MHIQLILSVIAGILAVIAYFPYGLAIWRRQTQPVRATWLIWSAQDIVIWFGMFSKNAQNIQMTVVTIGAVIIAILTLKYGKPGWTHFERFCMGFAAIGILLLLISEPMAGLIVGLVVNFIGSIPTMISSWQDPSRENRAGWLIIWWSSFCASLAIPAWTIADASQPLCFLMLSSIMMSILIYRTNKRANMH